MLASFTLRLITTLIAVCHGNYCFVKFEILPKLFRCKTGPVSISYLLGQFNFTSPRNITGIKTKGGAKGWVTSYKVMYSNDLDFSPIVDHNKEEV